MDFKDWIAVTLVTVQMIFGYLFIRLQARYAQNKKVQWRDVLDFLDSLEPVFFPLMMIVIGIIGFYNRFWLSDELFTIWSIIKLTFSIIVFIASLIFLIIGLKDRRKLLIENDLSLNSLDNELKSLKGLTEEDISEIKNFIEFTLSKNRLRS